MAKPQGQEFPAMFTRIRAAGENESGFTLIELLTVISIIGILAGIAVFSASGISDRGDKAACAANVKTVQVAQEAFYAKSTAVPPAYAASVDVLVTAKLLSDAPKKVTTDTTGKVTPTCTMPD